MDKAVLIYDETNNKITLDRKDLKEYQNKVNALKKEINQLRLMKLKANSEFFDRFQEHRVSNVSCENIDWNSTKNWINMGFFSKKHYFEMSMNKWNFKRMIEKAKENLVKRVVVPEWIWIRSHNKRNDGSTITLSFNLTDKFFERTFESHIPDDLAKQFYEDLKKIAKRRGW